MQLTAIFESWHIGDGNYPPFRCGMEVNLSFEIESLQELTEAAPDEPLLLAHVGNAEYHFVADVIRSYPKGGSPPIVVFDTGKFCFYIESNEAGGLSVGQRINGKGILCLDYYIWVEFPEHYPDPPDLFYNLRVVGITKVRIPDRFVHRYEKGKAVPTRLPVADVNSSDYERLETMKGQKFDEEFYLIDFETLEGRSIPRTFRS